MYHNKNSAGIMISGVSGTTFSGEPFRKFQAKRMYLNYKPKVNTPSDSNTKCIYWIVVTSIHKPSESVIMFRKVTEKYSKEWCCVVVMDKKTPVDDYIALQTDNFIVLTLELQSELSEKNGFSLIEFIPYNHFGRKNIGYLYAVSRGAELIYDTDDDNLLKEDVIPFIQPSADYLLVSNEEHVFNPYKIYQPTIKHSLWPRGIPLDSIMGVSSEFVDQKATNCKPSKPEDITLYQFLADHDPDVDAIYRLTNPLPINFDSSMNNPIVLQLGTIAPLNAQCLITHYSSIFGLYLPINIHGRVSDIWRSYYIQTLHKDLGQHVAFTKAHVTQYRNAHNYLADFNSEIPLYTQATELVKFVVSWQSTAPTLVERMEELAIGFFERGYFEIEDVFGIQHWISDLIELGYRFPPIRDISSKCKFPPLL
ncbi:hypothetical protein LOD99_15217 [Oopsacas minuta]|uniref:Glycosyltransferase n=1 Tax=Oopsacas minuta TaxID=111878 RepID=A0AAV7KBX7_9METZ|nr:hypothetical protein LOD99_15217 [Oopsacas minuta]